MKAVLLLLALLLPGGALVLVLLATWRAVKAARTDGFVAGFREELRLLRRDPFRRQGVGGPSRIAIQQS